MYLSEWFNRLSEFTFSLSLICLDQTTCLRCSFRPLWLVMTEQWPKGVNFLIASGCWLLCSMVPSFEICPGSPDCRGHSFLKFNPSVTFCTLVNCSFMIPRRSGPKVKTFPLFGESTSNSYYPLSAIEVAQPQVLVQKWAVLIHWRLSPPTEHLIHPHQPGFALTVIRCATEVISC